MNDDNRKVVIVPEKKDKIQRIKEKYGKLSMDDATAKKIQRLEVTNKILKAVSVVLGVATGVNAVIPDPVPVLDEAIMGGITALLSGASVIISNKIEDLANTGTTEIKTEEISELGSQMGNVLEEIKRKRQNGTIEKSTESKGMSI